MTKHIPTPHAPGKSPSHRQQRVAEEIRHILSQAILRGELPTEFLRSQSITITKVQVSPDLRNATVWLMPLGGAHQQEILAELKEAAQALRHYLAKNLRLRFVPELRLKIDTSFEAEDHMNKLFNKIKTPLSEE
jgi:ribosome-binding factor A